MAIAVGDKAPDFMLPDQDGKVHTLSDYRGRWLLLYFYPKDDTPGCTKESCMLRDTFPRFDATHARVIGISADSVESHAKFARKYDLPFPLIADTEKKVIEAYGVWGEKKMLGRTYRGIRRTSFLIDSEGVVRKIYERVKPEVHAEEVLADLASFEA